MDWIECCANTTVKMIGCETIVSTIVMLAHLEGENVCHTNMAVKCFVAPKWDWDNTIIQQQNGGGNKTLHVVDGGGNSTNNEVTLINDGLQR